MAASFHNLVKDFRVPEEMDTRPDRTISQYRFRGLDENPEDGEFVIGLTVKNKQVHLTYHAGEFYHRHDINFKAQYRESFPRKDLRFWARVESHHINSSRGTYNIHLSKSMKAITI